MLLQIHGAEEEKPFESKLATENVVHVEPPFVEYWKLIVPVGVMLRTPVAVVVAVTACLILIGPVAFRIGAVSVEFAFFTVRIVSWLVELSTSVSPLYVALNL